MDLTRDASTAARRDSPVAIAAASRNAIQEAKSRKAAARARMAQASSPGNIALREELAKDGSSAEAVETTIIVMRGMCIGWGVVEIALSLFGATLLMKVCRYFIPVEY